MLNFLRQYQRNIIMIIIIISAFECNGEPKTTIEKIRVFYQYDEMFFYGDKEKNKLIETGDIHEIVNLKDISEKYQKTVQKYIYEIDQYIKSNFKFFNEYYSIVDNFNKKGSIDEKTKNRYDTLKEELQIAFNDQLLSNLPGIIRCMYAIDSVQYIETAKKIGDNMYANTLNLIYYTTDNVYWTSYLLDSQPTKYNREDVLDKEGRMKYREWFYESNLKIRIVRQIRDEKGKYFGELYIDYYKLDEYDKLFDKDGNPKNPRAESK